jgi:hypothetical protein
LLPSAFSSSELSDSISSSKVLSLYLVPFTGLLGY